MEAALGGIAFLVLFALLVVLPTQLRKSDRKR